MVVVVDAPPADDDLGLEEGVELEVEDPLGVRCDQAHGHGQPRPLAERCAERPELPNAKNPDPLKQIGVLKRQTRSQIGGPNWTAFEPQIAPRGIDSRGPRSDRPKPSPGDPAPSGAAASDARRRYRDGGSSLVRRDDRAAGGAFRGPSNDRDGATQAPGSPWEATVQEVERVNSSDRGSPLSVGRVAGRHRGSSLDQPFHRRTKARSRWSALPATARNGVTPLDGNPIACMADAPPANASSRNVCLI